uniref:Uncharacterized protein n=1 Tax=Cacopsylla melanoneura TaxID=428564 RepID=A0A8D8L950_9HEMI
MLINVSRGLFFFPLILTPSYLFDSTFSDTLRLSYSSFDLSMGPICSKFDKVINSTSPHLRRLNNIISTATDLFNSIYCVKSNFFSSTFLAFSILSAKYSCNFLTSTDVGISKGFSHFFFSSNSLAGLDCST